MEEMNMKTAYRILAFAAAVAAAASCDLNKTPEFEDSMSFAAFDQTSVVVSENAGSVSIPVTIASIDPKKVAVAYQAVDGDGEKGAKAGINFRLKDDAAVLAFDGQTRTMSVDIDIINLPGEYTGDLTFTVQLVSAGGLNLGANSSCTVRISDLDHPLAEILGDYTASGRENWDGDLNWTVTFDKDPDDISVVWIENIASGLTVYGNVNEDKTQILIPLGQSSAYNASYNAQLVGFKSGGYYASEGNLELARTETGWALTDEEWGYGFLAIKISDNSIAGWLTAYYPGVVFTKQ